MKSQQNYKKVLEIQKKIVILQHISRKIMKHTILKSFLVALLAIMTVGGYANTREMQIRCVAFYNLENLFDTIHDEGKNDYEY